MERFSRVLVINPPSPPGFVSNKDSMGGFGQLFPPGATYMPPLDMVYLASFLTEKQVPVEVLECLGMELDLAHLTAAAARACGGEAEGRVLAVVRTSTPTLDWDLSVCAALKAQTAGLRLAICGAVVTHVAQRIQETGAVDYLVRGEPDDVVYELVQGRALATIPGLTYLGTAGWVENPPRLFDKNLDRLPFPKWELFPYTRYQLPKSSTHGRVAFLPMITSRGCPVGCHYCPYPVGQGGVFRYRTAQNVVDEMEHLAHDLGVQYILFRDPIFSLNQRRVLEICNEIQRRGLTIEWKCETRVDCLREETVRAMAQAGCTGINFGIESAEVEIQANSGRKPITQEEFIATVRLCHELGISTFGFFIIGLPGDTADTILDSIKFAIDVRTNWVQFTAASPLLGTKLRDWAISNGYVPEHEQDYVNSYRVMMGNENLSKEQVNGLLHFAQFIGTNFINRRGILKDTHAGTRVYRLGRQMADALTYRTAQVIYALGRWYFARRLAAEA
ncbi:MAG: hypothetical protein DCC57_19880 [Chloroflexi bacterium]|nr:MAG: hypothetical protein DCC57_19880 [Chloroflexota bacterium]